MRFGILRRPPPASGRFSEGANRSIPTRGFTSSPVQKPVAALPEAGRLPSTTSTRLLSCRWNSAPTAQKALPQAEFQATYGKPLLAARDSKCSPKDAEAGILAMEALHKQVMPFLLRRTKDRV